ncbi:MAG: class II D-tagatose-bisphosphate aldolase non-catalytic subunit [Vicinamibacteria bacterium]
MASVTRRKAPWLPDVVAAQKRGEAKGVYSVCSANRFVLEAAMQQAKADSSAVCIEATSNQVNVDGGYTGTTPAQFAAFIEEMARQVDFPTDRVLLGGDHLGPFPWADRDARTAMSKASETVRQYVAAGFVKIHLDASMRCADDPPGPLSDAAVTERAADLCAVAEAAKGDRSPSASLPLYVIGTEVPVPGGEQENPGHLAATRVEDAQRTLALTQQAFRARGLDDAWERVVGLVVQPGVEFGDATVFDYDRSQAALLKAFIESDPRIIFEAHSTDYQTGAALGALVLDHFAILKVGPALTFAFREAVFALAAIEEAWLGHRKGATVSRIREVLEDVMVERPGHWRRYYHGDEDQTRVARRYSLSDRIRYYWAEPRVETALTRLLQNLSTNPPPPSLVSQHAPTPYGSVPMAAVAVDPREIIRRKVLEVTATYAAACGCAADAQRADDKMTPSSGRPH